MKTNLLIDCDGTLYAQEQSIKNKAKKLFYQLAIKWFSKKRVLKMLNKHINSFDYNKIKPNEELYDIIIKLKKSYSVVIFTDGLSTHVKNVFKALFDKDPDIEIIDILSTSIKDNFNLKQSGGLRAYCLVRQINASNCILIDDCPQTIKKAKELKMKTIFIDNNTSINEALKKNLL